MQAAVLHNKLQISVEDVNNPVITEHEVLIKTLWCGICGSDLSAYRGLHPRIKPPTILGHECVGVIETLGDSVEGFKTGELVCVDPSLNCGDCPSCKTGKPHICPNEKVLGHRFDGAAAEYVKVPAQNIHIFPESCPTEYGALVQPLAISYRGVARTEISENDMVLILGAGQIGLGAVLFAKQLGAFVIITDVRDTRLERAQALGADQIINVEDNNLEELVHSYTDGKGVSKIIEAVGGEHQKPLCEALTLVQPGGIVTTLGSFIKPEMEIPINRLKYLEIQLRGSHGTLDSFKRVIEQLATGNINPDKMISHVLPLKDIAKGFGLLESDSVDTCKILLKP